MKLGYIALTLALSVGFGAAISQNAHAAGCVSGAAAGAVLGHVAGHHAVLGAVAGCVAGHEAAKHHKEMERAHAADARGQMNASY